MSISFSVMLRAGRKRMDSRAPDGISSILCWKAACCSFCLLFGGVEGMVGRKRVARHRYRGTAGGKLWSGLRTQQTRLQHAPQQHSLSPAPATSCLFLSATKHQLDTMLSRPAAATNTQLTDVTPFSALRRLLLSVPPNSTPTIRPRPRTSMMGYLHRVGCNSIAQHSIA